MAKKRGWEYEEVGEFENVPSGKIEKGDKRKTHIPHERLDSPILNKDGTERGSLIDTISDYPIDPDKDLQREEIAEGKYRQRLISEYTPKEAEFIEYLYSKAEPGMTYMEMAEKAGVSKNTVDRAMEKIKADPKKLAKILKS